MRGDTFGWQFNSESQSMPPSVCMTLQQQPVSGLVVSRRKSFVDRESEVGVALKRARDQPWQGSDHVGCINLACGQEYVGRIRQLTHEKKSVDF